MSRSSDPVVHSVLRVFVWLQVFGLGITALAYTTHDQARHAEVAVWVMLGTSAILLVGSFFPTLRARAWYLPALLAVLVAIPAAGQMLALLHSELASQKLLLELSPYLFVPALVVAWQYSFRAVVLLSLGTGVLDAGLALLGTIDQEHGELTLHVLASRTVGLLLAGYIISRLVGEQRKEHACLERAHAQLAQHAAGLERLTISRERNRMARELHDTLAHTLSAMAVQLEAVRSVWHDHPDQARSMTERALAMAREGLAGVRRSLQSLRASPLEDLGLVLAIQSMAETMREHTGIELELRLSEPRVALSSPVEQGVYRVAQEAIENVERHSHARHATVALGCAARRLTLVVADDGVGFEPGRVPDDRYGLRGIRERADLLGALLEVAAQPEKGATVTLVVELDAGSGCSIELGQGSGERS